VERGFGSLLSGFALDGVIHVEKESLETPISVEVKENEEIAVSRGSYLSEFRAKWCDSSGIRVPRDSYIYRNQRK
jgi:hypothetical protein